tara:strand:+ start:332 stop:670 length:339 start_codon:yes stop_codon:yes gene_type:complete
MSDEIKEHTKSLRDLAEAALEYTFIEGSGDFTTRKLRLSLEGLHVTASLHRRRVEIRATSIRDYLASAQLDGTPADYQWFGCETDAELVDAVNEEMANWNTQEEALEVMLHG